MKGPAIGVLGDRGLLIIESRTSTALPPNMTSLPVAKPPLLLDCGRRLLELIGAKPEGGATVELNAGAMLRTIQCCSPRRDGSP